MTFGPSVAREALIKVGLDAPEIELAAPQGVANETYLCGRWVVKLSKDPEYLEDLRTESVAAPAVVAARVNTPKPIHFSLEPDGDLPPFSVWNRVQGQPLAARTSLKSPRRFFRQYGTALRKVHDIRKLDDPHGFLDDAWHVDLPQLVADSREFGLQSWVERLADRVTLYTPCFVHQDLHAENVLVDEADKPVFIDWGDAGMGDPAVDFRFIPPQFLTNALHRGYGPFPPGMDVRIALHMVEQFIYVQRHQRDYGVFGQTNPIQLVVMMTFVLGDFGEM